MNIPRKRSRTWLFVAAASTCVAIDLVVLGNVKRHGLPWARNVQIGDVPTSVFTPTDAVVLGLIFLLNAVAVWWLVSHLKDAGSRTRT